MSKRTIQNILILSMIVVAIFYWKSSRPIHELDWDLAQKKEMEKKLPVLKAGHEFRLEDLKGKKVAFGGLKEDYLLVHFWATWCEPCKEEFPLLSQLSEWLTLNNKNLSVAALSVAEDRKVVLEFLRKMNINPNSGLRIWVDSLKEASMAFGSERYPETFLIERKTMKVLRKFVGPQRWDDEKLREQLKSIGAESIQ